MVAVFEEQIKSFFFKYRDVIGGAWGDGDSLVAVSVLVDVAALRHHALLVQGEGQLQLGLGTQDYSLNRQRLFILHPEMTSLYQKGFKKVQCVISAARGLSINIRTKQ